MVALAYWCAIGVGRCREAPKLVRVLERAREYPEL